MSTELLIRAASAIKEAQDSLIVLSHPRFGRLNAELTAIAAELEAMAEHLTQRPIPGWEIAAESWHDVEAFCRQHPGERVTLLAVPEVQK